MGKIRFNYKSNIINNTNIYDRGSGRAHIQKPIHRIIYQIRLIFLEFFYDQRILKKT